MASWWPWRRAAPEPPPQATHTVAAAPAAPGAQHWRWLPPIQRAIGDIELTAPLARFTASLTTARAPIFGSPMPPTIDGAGLPLLGGPRSNTAPPAPGRPPKDPAGRAPAMQRRITASRPRASIGPGVGSVTVTPAVRPEPIDAGEWPVPATEHPMTVARQPDDEGRVLPPIDEPPPEPELEPEPEPEPGKPEPQPSNGIPSEFPTVPPAPVTTVAGETQPDPIGAVPHQVWERRHVQPDLSADHPVSTGPQISQRAAGSPGSESPARSAGAEPAQIQRLPTASTPPQPGTKPPTTDLPATITQHTSPHVSGARATSADGERPAAAVAPPARPADSRPQRDPHRSDSNRQQSAHRAPPAPEAIMLPLSRSVTADPPRTHPPGASSTPISPVVARMTDGEPPPTIPGTPSTTWVEDTASPVESPYRPLDNLDELAPPPSETGPARPATEPVPLPTPPPRAAAVRRTETPPPTPATARGSFTDSFTGGFADSAAGFSVRAVSARPTGGERPQAVESGRAAAARPSRRSFHPDLPIDADAAVQRLAVAERSAHPNPPEREQKPPDLGSWDPPVTGSSMVSEPVAPSLPPAWTPPTPPDTPSPQAIAGSTGIGAPVRRAAPVQRSNPAADPGPSGKVHRVGVVDPPPPGRTPRSAPENPHMSAGGPLVGAPIPSSTTTPVDDAAVQRACAPATSVAAWRTEATSVQRVPGRGLDQETGPSTPPQPVRMMPLQQMFAPVQDSSPRPDPSAPGAEASATVQRESVPSGPAAATATSTTPSGPAAAGAEGAAGAAGSVNTDELATRLYEPLVARIKAELWLDRERAGVLTDPRY